MAYQNLSAAVDELNLFANEIKIRLDGIRAKYDVGISAIQLRESCLNGKRAEIGFFIDAGAFWEKEKALLKEDEIIKFDLPKVP